MAKEDIFVGREKELKLLFELYASKRSLSAAVIGEPGIGKSSFLKELVRRIRNEPNARIFVGFHEVLDGTANVASPFVSCLDDLMGNLSLPLQERTKEGVRRITAVANRIFAQKQRTLAKSILKRIATKYLGVETVEELTNAYEEWKQTPTIESLEEETFLKYRDEFVHDFIFFLQQLANQYKEVSFMLVVDQLERAPLISCQIMLGLLRAKPDNFHIIFSFKAGREGTFKYETIKSELLQLNVRILNLPYLTQEEIGEWIETQTGREFSRVELRKIRELSGGFPYLIDNWLQFSKALDPNELEVGREGYCQFIEWCFEHLSDKCLLLLRRMSVLQQPLPISRYEELSGNKTGDCSLLLEEAERNRILIRQEGSFWFKHDLIKPCIEWKLSDTEKQEYQGNAARLFEKELISSVETGKGVEFRVAVGCSYHSHKAGDFNKSLSYNLNLGVFCLDTGRLDLAEECFLRSVEAADKVGDEESKMIAIGNLAHVYLAWGRVDDAFKTHKEMVNFFRRHNNQRSEAAALHSLAIIEEKRGNFGAAIELHKESLSIKKELGDKQGISYSLHQMANVYEELGKYEKALGLHEEALKIDEEADDTSSISKTLAQLGSIENRRGNFDKAITLYRQSLTIEQKFGNKVGIASTLHNMGVAQEGKGNLVEAEKLYEQGLLIADELGNKAGISRSLNQLGSIARKRGNLTKAGEFYQKSLSISEDLGDRAGAAISKANLGLIEAEQGHAEQAFIMLLEAASVFYKIGSPEEDPALADLTLVLHGMSPKQFIHAREDLPDCARVYLAEIGSKATS